MTLVFFILYSAQEPNKPVLSSLSAYIPSSTEEHDQFVFLMYLINVITLIVRYF
jgi:hypothetical protein